MAVPFWLFGSVDLVGSTEFKIRRPTPTWPPIFRNFLTEAPGLIVKTWQAERKNLMPAGPASSTASLPPRAWRFLGDEVIVLQSHLTYDPREYFITLNAFFRAISRIRRDIELQSRGLMSARGALWIADREKNIIFDKRGESFNSEFWNLDFLGPSIDAGFRMSAYATKRKVALSIEAARLLGDAIISLNANKQLEGRMVYLEGDVLKGVFSNGDRYPRLVVRDKALKRRPLRDRLLQRRPISARELREVCGDWIDTHGDRLFDPL